MRLIDADALFKKVKAECNPYGKPTIGFEDGKRVMNWIKQAPTVGGWVSVKDRMPAETHSIFWRLFGSEKWTNAMWREQSGKVLVTVAFKDGMKIVTTGETHDGVWSTTISRTLEPIVTHWQAMPEPPEEVSGDA